VNNIVDDFLAAPRDPSLPRDIPSFPGTGASVIIEDMNVAFYVLQERWVLTPHRLLMTYSAKNRFSNIGKTAFWSRVIFKELGCNRKNYSRGMSLVAPVQVLLWLLNNSLLSV
jgi:hypothetical protein